MIGKYPTTILTLSLILTATAASAQNAPRGTAPPGAITPISPMPPAQALMLPSIGPAPLPLPMGETPYVRYIATVPSSSGDDRTKVRRQFYETAAEDCRAYVAAVKATGRACLPQIAINDGINPTGQPQLTATVTLLLVRSPADGPR